MGHVDHGMIRASLTESDGNISMKVLKGLGTSTVWEMISHSYWVIFTSAQMPVRGITVVRVLSYKMFLLLHYKLVTTSTVIVSVLVSILLSSGIYHGASLVWGWRGCWGAISLMALENQYASSLPAHSMSSKGTLDPAELLGMCCGPFYSMGKHKSIHCPKKGSVKNPQLGSQIKVAWLWYWTSSDEPHHYPSTKNKIQNVVYLMRG